jgi:hypothetical protein
MARLCEPILRVRCDLSEGAALSRDVFPNRTVYPLVIDNWRTPPQTKPMADDPAGVTFREAVLGSDTVDRLPTSLGG